MTKQLSRAALALLLAGAIAVALAYREQFDPAAIEAALGAAGPAGPLLFIALYALAAVLFLPGSLLTLAGGALFGPLLGTLYSLTGATAGAALAFLVARYLAADAVERRAGGRLRRLVDGVSAEGWRFVAFVRLVPLFPFNLLNYALGLTRIRFVPYLLATALCMLPGAAAYSWLGHAGRAALEGGEGWVQTGLLALGALALVWFLPRLVGRLRRGATLEVTELARRLREDPAWLLVDLRSAGDFAASEHGHIDGALNLPLEELDARLAELEREPGRPIALICTTQKRSLAAARRLAAQGFAGVHVVSGGMVAWRAAGLPSASAPTAAATAEAT